MLVLQFFYPKGLEYKRIVDAFISAYVTSLAILPFNPSLLYGSKYFCWNFYYDIDSYIIRPMFKILMDR
jgi:hypothetical protein